MTIFLLLQLVECASVSALIVINEWINDRDVRDEGLFFLFFVVTFYVISSATHNQEDEESVRVFALMQLIDYSFCCKSPAKQKK